MAPTIMHIDTNSEMMNRKGFVSNREICEICSKTVYPTEKMTVESKPIHQSCFKCHHCKRQLTLSNFASVNQKVYCKTHYIELFKKAGGKYGRLFYLKSCMGMKDLRVTS